MGDIPVEEEEVDFIKKKCDEQVATFTHIFEGNNRPVQTLNQREVIQDTSE